MVDKRKKITFKYMYLIVKLTILIYLCIILFPGQTCGYIVQPDNGAGYVQDNVRPLDPCYARQWPVGTRVRFACLEGYERQGAFEMSRVATGNSANWDAQTPRCNLSESLNSKQECIPVGCVPSAAVAVCWRRVSSKGVYTSLLPLD